MIKVFGAGVISHIFEVESKVLDESSHMIRYHYTVVPGSLCYIKDNKVCYFEADFLGKYPTDECRDPTKRELELYESADVI